MIGVLNVLALVALLLVVGVVVFVWTGRVGGDR